MCECEKEGIMEKREAGRVNWKGREQAAPPPFHLSAERRTRGS